LIWRVHDAFPALVGPSSFTVSIPGSAIIKVEDNALNDLDPVLGQFVVKLPVHTDGRRSL
jgi:hypothetical protein